MVPVARIALRRHGDRSAGERQAIGARETTARVGPRAQARQARTQDRSLHLVEPRVDARLLVMVPVGLTTVAQPFDLFRERGVVGGYRAAVAERPEILRRVEAERARDADRA